MTDNATNQIDHILKQIRGSKNLLRLKYMHMTNRITAIKWKVESIIRYGMPSIVIKGP